MRYSVFIGTKNTKPQTFTVLQIFLGYQILREIIFFKFSCRNHYDKMCVTILCIIP